MSSVSLYWQEPMLPWTTTEPDRRFRRFVLLSLLFCLLVGLLVPFLPRPVPEQKELKDVAPRLAKLVLEKKKLPPPPPPPKPEAKKPEPEPKEVARKPQPEPKKPESARQKAERSGLLAMRDELADLRESFSVDKAKRPLTQKAEKATPQANSQILTARATQGSGGINTRSLSRDTGGGQLASRNTTGVSSSIGSDRPAERRTRSGQAARGEEEIELVFQRNKSAIFSLYNRALRQDPSLQGKVVLELTITPSGEVSQCRIVSSELNNPELERRLVTRIKLFRFSAKAVATTTITYPIDFLPS
ncbi:MAG: AgmX/PglI C-terminal domain-containing protein [Gammaproteobacteria bacterium]